MLFWIINTYYQLQVKFLILFKPTSLFDRINELGWYKDMLCQWVGSQGFTEKSKILEVGCATGTLTTYIASLGHVTTGVDYSKGMIKMAQAKKSNSLFSIASILDLPFKNNTYDAVIAASLVNIVSDKKKAVNELFRVCKQRGRVTILVPSSEFTDEDLLSLKASLNTYGFSASAINAWHSLAPKMETNELLHLFKQTGLENITTHSYLQGMVVSISGTKPVKL